MTMSIARLSAQSGLRYLFKTTMMDDLPLAPVDATSYYLKAGTPPGRWIGSGLPGISRSAKDAVTEIDAKALFEYAVHPDTAAPLGRPHSKPTVVRTARGRTETRHAVVGFDLTFSVPKSVSVLWALSPRSVQNEILQIHHAAVKSALQWLEDTVVHTRSGRGGIAQFGTRGVIAAAFDHWESRAGDPQLHTHIVIANRVQRITDGAWVTLDSRTLYKAAVAASEHYNGLLFDALHRNLGTDTEIRIPASGTHNPRQHLTGIDDDLVREFSNRSRLIDLETDKLVAEWTTQHGAPPTATATLKLRQQATLSTRTPKPETIAPLHELSALWQARAKARGFEAGLVLADAIRRSHPTRFTANDFSAAWIDAVATLTRQRVAAKRATWNRWNLLAEAERVCADVRCDTPADRNAMIDAVATAAETQCVALNEHRYSLPPDAGPDLRFRNGAVFDFHGSRLYTDTQTLACEDSVMAARDDDGGPAVRPALAMEALTKYRHHGRFELHADQRAVAGEVLSSGNRLDAVVGPAGTGKTTTLGAIKAAWETEHGAGSVIGLAPAAASAEILGRELAMTTENVAKWLHESVGRGAAQRAEQFYTLERRFGDTALPRTPLATRLAQQATRLAAEQNRWRFHPNQLVVVDEASMVSTPQLSSLVTQARDAGAKILLVGDPAQLDAIDAGGILGWLDRQHKTARLTTIWRFNQPWERDASLQLRAGNYSAVAAYDQHQRLRHGSYLDMVDLAYLNWQTDTVAGKACILIAPDNDTVHMLNERAQAARVNQGVVDAEQTVNISDGQRAGRGDTIIARHNDRTLRDSNGDFIRNGTLLDVVCVSGRDSSVLAARRDTGATAILRRDYLEASVELGYATTAHRAQGITADTSHTVVTQGRLTRELFYVGMTRGRTGNHAYVCENDPLDDEVLGPGERPSWRQILGEVLAAEGAERTAHETLETEQATGDSLERLSAEFDYLAQIAGAEDLSKLVESHDAGAVAGFQQSPSWGAAVAAWRRASSINRPGAERLVRGVVETVASAKDPAAVLHHHFRQYIAKMPTNGPADIHETVRTARPDVANLMEQVRARIQHRQEQVTQDALMLETEWKHNLLESLPRVVPPEVVLKVLRGVAIFRDTWGVGDSPLPLGPVPADYEWAQQKERASLEQAIDQARRYRPPENLGHTNWVNNGLHTQASSSAAGWEL
ncbi:MobF family relaxase [Arthrobacter sp. FW306-07-I]|uniref:MobF family relaxase n=1 Tax=Arthrobacter sp. FW306-07-I TaxID=2879622 RepID=UPI001F27E09F|nr:MobF family relaxase [Arthrobacter sp. FW306-07-I]UKA76147.1 relaxase domain-containing protein [Arthrobacter sp. FW306-07-I]